MQNQWHYPALSTLTKEMHQVNVKFHLLNIQNQLFVEIIVWSSYKRLKSYAYTTVFSFYTDA